MCVPFPPNVSPLVTTSRTLSDRREARRAQLPDIVHDDGARRRLHHPPNDQRLLHVAHHKIFRHHLWHLPGDLRPVRLARALLFVVRLPHPGGQFLTRRAHASRPNPRFIVAGRDARASRTIIEIPQETKNIL